MRNIFDQYTQPENRLTHALLSCLNADRRLLQEFARRFVGISIRGRKVEVLEQSLPGEPGEMSSEEAERRGLPDGCIADSSGDVILIESKFAAGVSVGQLRRHKQTALRNDLKVRCLLLLCTEPPRRQLPSWVTPVLWSTIYSWLYTQRSGSPWAKVCMEYMEVAETRAANDEYLTRGGITVFSGIPFSADNPFSYGQAKRLLRLFMQEMRRHKGLLKALPVDVSHPGRGAITGRMTSSVWDFLALEAPRKADVFTQHPHLTAGIHSDRVSIYLTVPNGVRSYMRTRLLSHDYEEFQERILAVAKSINKVSGNRGGVDPYISLLQRHYLSQSSPGIVDALIRFNPLTAETAAVRGKVKRQPQWLRATYDALRHRRSNLQFQIGADLSYAKCPPSEPRLLLRWLPMFGWLASQSSM